MDPLEELTDALTGKVLCVCASAAVAARLGLQDKDRAALGAVERWIDEPTDAAFDAVCATWADETISRTVGWAARAAMSTVGNYEAGWALESLLADARADGLCDRAAVSAAVDALRSRASR